MFLSQAIHTPLVKIPKFFNSESQAIASCLCWKAIWSFQRLKSRFGFSSLLRSHVWHRDFILEPPIPNFFLWQPWVETFSLIIINFLSPQKLQKQFHFYENLARHSIFCLSVRVIIIDNCMLHPFSTACHVNLAEKQIKKNATVIDKNKYCEIICLQGSVYIHAM